MERLLAADVATQKQLDDLTAKERILKKQISAQQSYPRQCQCQHYGTVYDPRNSGGTSGPNIQVLPHQSTHRRSASEVHSKGRAGSGEPTSILCNEPRYPHPRAYITGNQLAQIKLGDKVSVQTDDGSGSMRSYQGSISWIASKAGFHSQNHSNQR